MACPVQATKRHTVKKWLAVPPSTNRCQMAWLYGILCAAKKNTPSVYAAPPPQEATRTLEAAMRSRMARLEDELTAERRARAAAQVRAILADRLAVDIHVLTAATPPCRNLDLAVRNAHLDVEDAKVLRMG